MENCIFCKITAGEIPSVKLRENDKFIAILDAFPACKGHTLVITKEHYNADVSQMDNTFFGEYMQAVHEVINLLKQGTGVQKIGIVVEGLEVNHAHVKLYPFWDNKGFPSSLGGDKMADINELEKVKNEILA